MHDAKLVTTSTPIWKKVLKLIAMPFAGVAGILLVLSLPLFAIFDGNFQDAFELIRLNLGYLLFFFIISIIFF